MYKYIKNSSDTKTFKIRATDEANTAMDLMSDMDQYQEDPMVGIFWYSPKGNNLYGVNQQLASSIPFQHNSLFNVNAKTGSILHEKFWRMKSRGHDTRYRGDYTKFPRGRVFEFEDDGFKVFTGEWINEYPQAKEEILIEFQLPVDNTEFLIDEHWDIGHGFSDEYL